MIQNKTSVSGKLLLFRNYKNNTITKNNIVKQIQFFFTKNCNYHFSVQKNGKQEEFYYITNFFHCLLNMLSLAELKGCMA